MKNYKCKIYILISYFIIMKKEALIVVDYQNDFASPEWSLYVQGWEKLLPFINNIMQEIKSKSWIILTSQDWHHKNHISFASRFQVPEYSILNWERKWPEHCISETWWADFLDGFDTNLVDRKLVKWFQKNLDSYSSFGWIEIQTGQNLHQILQSYQIQVLNIVWVATECCDLSTIKDALQKWYEVNVFSKGIAPVNKLDWERAIQEMIQLWARIID